MTGPEHYQKAEHLAKLAEGQEIDHALLTLTRAQVHATLALAAATALGLPAGSENSWDAMPPADASAWVDAAGVPRD